MKTLRITRPLQLSFGGSQNANYHISLFSEQKVIETKEIHIVR